MKRKLLGILLVAGLALSVLAGCGSQASASASESNEGGDGSEIVNIKDIETQDIYGEKVKLSDIYAKNTVTLVNEWGTFCGPCLGEMPDLEKLSEEYADKGFGIVGLTCDVMDSNEELLETLDDAKEIAAEKGITYPLLVETPEMLGILKTTAVPTSYFVDANGNLIGEKLVGSRSYEDWEALIKEHLEK